MGLNISKTAENSLIEAISRLEKPNILTNGGEHFEKVKARGVGFEPTRPFDHRLSRPAPYQAWGTPPAFLA